MPGQHAYPTLSFVIPIQNGDNFIIEQINSIFQLSKHYKGFCEIIIIADGANDYIIKLAWLAIKLNKTKNPHVRAEITRHTTQLGLNEIVKTALTRAFGEKIIIALNPTQNTETKDTNQLNQLYKGLNILRQLITTETLKEILDQNSFHKNPEKN